MRLLLSILGLVALSTMVAETARAGSLEGTSDSYLLGDRAALMSGACVAVQGGPGSAWYNPAGLAAVEGSSVNVSASAFMLRSRQVPDLLQHELASGEQVSADLDSTEFLSVPSSMVAVWKLSETLAFTVGVFVPRSDTMSSDHTLALLAEDSEFNDQLSESFRWDQMHGGVALGWQATDWMRVGAAVNLVSDTRRWSYSMIWHSRYTEEDVETYVDTGTMIQQATSWGFALQSTLGLQFDLGHDLHLGLAVQSPLMQMYSDFKLAYVDSSGGGGMDGGVAGDFDAEEMTESGFNHDWLSPLRVRLGLAYELKGGWISVEGDLSLPLEGGDMGLHTEATWNVKAGAIIPLADTVRLGFGLFTDRSMATAPEYIHDAQVDFYGLTLGSQWDTLFNLEGDGEGDKDTLKMSTTLAVRYAAGLGTYGTEWHDPDAFDWILSKQDVVFHEFSVHIGSGVSF